MTPQTLANAGISLHGDDWRAPLARQLGVAWATIERWRTGVQRIPQHRAAAVAALLSEEAADLATEIELITTRRDALLALAATVLAPDQGQDDAPHAANPTTVAPEHATPGTSGALCPVCRRPDDGFPCANSACPNANRNSGDNQ